MNVMRVYLAIPVLLFLLATAEARCLKEIILNPNYDHDRYAPSPAELVKDFRAYTVSFDGPDDDNGDGVRDALGVPHWVSMEVKAFTGACVPTGKRPRDWCSEPILVSKKLAPTDRSYAYSRDWRKQRPEWFVRGHLAMKLLAERLGADAAWNTHTVLNAVPQRHKFNGGIWLELERITGIWAQMHGRVWVIMGPIIPDDAPSGRIGGKNEFKVAIPDAIFKVVVREDGEVGAGLDVLAFIYPQVGPRYLFEDDYPHTHFLASVDEIEERTGLDFFDDLPPRQQANIELRPQRDIWPIDWNNEISACRAH